MALEGRRYVSRVDGTAHVTGVVEGGRRRPATIARRVEVHRGGCVGTGPGRDLRRSALLAVRAPVGHPGLLAVAADVDGGAAAVARLAVAAVHRHPLRAAGQRRADRLVEVGLEEGRGGLEEAPAGLQVDGRDRGEGMHPAGPQHLPLVHVAHPRRHPLVEQELGGRGGLVAELGDPLHGRGDVEAGIAQVRTDGSQPGWEAKSLARKVSTTGA